ncbi:MAG TPA: alanine racemase, partial [Terriglobales bacterium]|nr:alanine racemase [Terriglobales bacterium]
AARELGKKLPVLIEINIGDETAKSGIAPDSRELENLLGEAEKLEHLEFCGLMTIPPFREDPQQARPYFRRLRVLRDQMAARKPAGVGLETLSMGMSHDFEVAIEEGSTCVRLGTAIFGERLKP